MEAAYKLSARFLPRMRAFHGVGLPVPKYSRSVTGSYTAASHTVPPPPSFHHSCPSTHVFAAFSSAGLSNPLAGSPGTVQKRHASLPVSASKAAIQPRTPNSPPDPPMNTLPFATRGAIVIEYFFAMSPKPRLSGTVSTDHTS